MKEHKSVLCTIFSTSIQYANSYANEAHLSRRSSYETGLSGIEVSESTRIVSGLRRGITLSSSSSRSSDTVKKASAMFVTGRASRTVCDLVPAHQSTMHETPDLIVEPMGEQWRCSTVDVRYQ